MSKPLSIYILCGNATYNRGDRANLTTQIDLLRSAYPDAQITVGSFRPEVDAHWYDAVFVQRGSILSRAQWKGLRSADVIIWGGGSLLTDHTGILSTPYWFFLLLLTKIFLRKPVMAWAHGLVIRTALGSLFAKGALSLTDVATVRDHDSFLTAQKLHVWKTKIIETADTAILFEGTSPEKGAAMLAEQGIPTNRPLIGITPTFWPQYHRTYDLLPYAIARQWGLRKHRGHAQIITLLKAYAAAMDLLIDHLDCTVLLLPRYANDPWPDIAYLQQLRTLVHYPDRVHILETDAYAPKTYYSLWHHFSCLLSGTLHDCIIACAVGPPCVHISYEKKGEQFFQAINAPNLSLTLEAFLKDGGSRKVARLVEHCVRNAESIRTQIMGYRNILRTRARGNLKVFRTLLSTVPSSH